MKKIIQYFYIIPIFALILGICIPQVFSHGGGGEFKVEQDGYLLDVGYEPQYMTAGYASTFNFRLTKDEEEVDFSDVWVRITSDNATTFATGIFNQELGGATLLYTFPQEGTYEINFRFEKDGETITESKMPVTVLPDELSGGKSQLPIMIILGLGGLILGALLGFLIPKLLGGRGNKKKENHDES